MAGQGTSVYCDKTECILGESISFNSTSSVYDLGYISYGDEINFYEDNILIYSDNNGLSTNYTYTPSTVGTHTIKIEGNSNSYVTVTITVTPPVKSFSSLHIPSNPNFTSSNWKKITGNNASFSTNQITVTSVGSGRTLNPFTNLTHYTLEFDWVSSTERCVCRYGLASDTINENGSLINWGGDISSNGYGKVQVRDYINGAWTTVSTTNSVCGSTGTTYHFKIIRDGQKVQLYVNNTLRVDRTFEYPIDNIIGMWKWGSGLCRLSNISLPNNVIDKIEIYGK